MAKEKVLIRNKKEDLEIDKNIPPNMVLSELGKIAPYPRINIPIVIGKYEDGRQIVYNISIVGVIMGCGLAQLSGLSGLREDRLDLYKEAILKACKEARTYGVGTLLATLGDNYITIMPLMRKLGFRKVAKYNNWAHGSEYYQILYTLKVKESYK